MRKAPLLIFVLFLNTFLLDAQPWMEYLPKKKSDAPYNFYDYQRAFNTYWEGRDYERGKGHKPFRRWEWFMETRIDEKGYYRPGQLWEASKYRYDLGKKSKGSEASWTYIGPDSVPLSLVGDYPIGLGRIDAIAFHPTDSNTYWIGAPTGGLWKTTDNGRTWRVLTDTLPTIGIGDIAIHPTNPNTIYIGTGDRDAFDLDGIGVLKSIDGGETWEPTGLSFPMSNENTVNRLLINPNSPLTMLAGTNKGLYRATDGGNNWTRILTNHIKDMTFKPDDPSQILATSYGTQAKIYRSLDGGLNFTESVSGIPTADARRIALAVTPVNSDVVYALVANTDGGLLGVYRSINFGGNWQQVFSGTSKNLLVTDPDGQGTGGQGWYDLSIAVSPLNLGEVYVGGINLWKSTNGGNNWELISFGYPQWGISDAPYVHVDHHILRFHPITGALYCGNDGGIYRSYDKGASWQDISDGLRNLQIYRIGSSATNPRLVITGSQDNGSFLIRGDRWREILGGDGMESIIDYSDTSVLYASFQYGRIGKSFNGGYNWYNVTPANAGDGAWVTPYIMHPSDPEILYAGYSDVYKTVNGGAAWTRVSQLNLASTERLHSLAISPSHPSYVYAASRRNIWKSTNGGQNWENVTGNLPIQPITYIAVSQYDPHTLWVTFSAYAGGNKVFYTEDGGQSWENYTANLPNVPVNCIVYENNSNHAIYAGTDIGVFYRNRGMDEWVAFNDQLPNVIVNEMEIQYMVGKIRAGTYGRGLWESDLYEDTSGALYAEFTVNRVSACVESSFQFINKSPNDIDSLRWDFGEGATPSTSDLDTVDVLFSEAGKKDISLTVYLNGESVTESRTQYVSVLSKIILNILPEEGYVPLGDTIRLVASGADLYAWSPSEGLDQDTGYAVNAFPDTTIVYTVAGTQGICSDEKSVTVNVILNDDVCNALHLNPGMSGPFFNINATVEDNEPMPDTLGTNACTAPMKWCPEGGLQNSVWFTFTGPESGLVSIDTRGFDTQIAVYAAESCDDLLTGNYTLLAANDDYYGQDLFYAAAIEKLDGLTPGETYYLQVDGSAGGARGSFTVALYDTPLGAGSVPSDKTEELVRIYPNPGDGSFNFHFNRQVRGNTIISIFNLNGQMVYQESMKEINQGDTFSISLNQPSGIYFISVVTNGTALRKKLVVR